MRKSGHFFVNFTSIILLYCTVLTNQQSHHDDGLPGSAIPQLPGTRSARLSSQPVNMDRFLILNEEITCEEKAVVCEWHLLRMDNDLQPPEKSEKLADEWPNIRRVHSSERKFRQCCEDTEEYIQAWYPHDVQDLLPRPKITVEDLEQVDANDIEGQNRMRERLENQHCLARYTNSKELTCLSHAHFLEKQNAYNHALEESPRNPSKKYSNYDNDEEKKHNLDDFAQAIYTLKPYCEAIQIHCNRKVERLDILNWDMRKKFELFQGCCETRFRDDVRDLGTVPRGSCKAGTKLQGRQGWLPVAQTWADTMLRSIGKPRAPIEFMCKPHVKL